MHYPIKNGIINFEEDYPVGKIDIFHRNGQLEAKGYSGNIPGKIKKMIIKKNQDGTIANYEFDEITKDNFWESLFLRIEVAIELEQIIVQARIIN